MTVRTAKFGDIPAIYALMVEAHARSIYAGRDEIDQRHAKGLLMNAIQRVGARHEGAMLVLVSEHDGAVTGFMVGLLDRLYQLGTKLFATDLFFYHTPGGNPVDPIGLLMGLVEWANTIPNVIEIKVGSTNVIGDHREIAKLYEGAGFKQCGALYEWRIER